jgi:hypothetical protein
MSVKTLNQSSQIVTRMKTNIPAAGVVLIKICASKDGR